MVNKMKIINEKEILFKDGKYVFTLKRAYDAAFGFGEKFDSVNQKGKFVRACVREKCFYQGEYTYLSMPFFVTPNGFGIYVETYVETDFDLTKEGEIVLSFEKGSKGEKAKIYLLEGTIKQMIGEFRKLAGMPRVFPKWVLGAWMSSNRWSNQADIEEQLANTKKYNFPHNVLVVERWSDLTTHCIWNGAVAASEPMTQPIRYDALDFSASADWQNPKKLVEELHADDIKMLLWVIPIYAQADSIETKWNVERCLKENEYVKQQKDCVMNADGTPYEIPHTWCIGSLVPDFTDPQAKKRWFDRFQHLKDIGFDGFKTDGGEFIHDHSVEFFDGTTGKEGQNAYCEQYSSAFAEFVGKDGIVFSRSGGVKSPTFSVIWAGDQESTWSEFASVLKAGMSAGISGVNCWGYDIAGFSGYLPTAELYLRAVQAAAFIPVMQWHSDPVTNNRCDFTGAWKINDRSPWNIAAFHKDEKLLELLRDSFRLHYNLIPYQYNLMLEAAATGVSPMRHLSVEFPDDKNTYDLDDEFMLGDALLIAPVLQDYISSRKIYLPKGKWYGLFDGKCYEGGTLDLPLKREYTPVFMRENSCVALNLKDGKLCSDVGNKLDGYEELTFLVSGKGQYSFRDDLGNDIVISWTATSEKVERNSAGLPIKIIHIGV
jgi:alpha-D-xyloside xylohydrolase